MLVLSVPDTHLTENPYVKLRKRSNILFSPPLYSGGPTKGHFQEVAVERRPCALDWFY